MICVIFVIFIINLMFKRSACWEKGNMFRWFNFFRKIHDHELRIYVNMNVTAGWYLIRGLHGLSKFCCFVGIYLTGLLNYNAKHFITLFNVHEDVNSWLRVPYEVHEHWSPTNNNKSREGSTLLSVFWCLMYFT